MTAGRPRGFAPARPRPGPVFETFDHTADLGIRVRAASFDELLTDGAHALAGVLVEEPDAEAATLRESIELGSDSAEDLFFDWLAELLFLFATRRFVARRFEIERNGHALRATVYGWRFDPAVHAGAHEVKAITYHGLAVTKDADGWLAEAILDI